MLLFEEDKKNIRVHNFLIDKGKMYNYKKSEMTKIPEDERLLRALTNQDYPLAENKTNLDYYDLNNEIYNGLLWPSYFHVLCPYIITDEESLRQKDFLEKYYQFLDSYGSFYHIIKQKPNYINKINSWPLLKLNPIDITDKGLYLIPTSKYKSIGSGSIVMDNILNVPESLYYLEQFMASKYTNIPDSYILEFMNLYYPKETKCIDINTYNTLVECNLTNKRNLTKQIENSTKVLKLIKKD